jgi:hypothetical protein
VIDAAGTRHIGVGSVLRLEGIVPQFARTIRDVSAQGHCLVAREKRRKALGANTQVQMAYFLLDDFRFAKRAYTHGHEYSYFNINNY